MDALEIEPFLSAGRGVACVRPLIRLPKSERKEAWSEAVKAAGRLGEPVRVEAG